MKNFRIKNLIFPVIALAIMFLGKTAMASTIDFNGFRISDEQHYSEGVTSFTVSITVPTDFTANSALVCAYSTAWENSNYNYLRYDGNNMTEISSVQNGSNVGKVRLFYLYNPRRGTYLLTGSQPQNWYHVQCRTIENVNTHVVPTVITQGRTSSAGSPWYHYYSSSQFMLNSLLISNYASQNTSSYSPASHFLYANPRMGFAEISMQAVNANNPYSYKYTFSGTNYSLTSQIVEFKKKPDVEITNYTEGQTVNNLLDTTLTIAGSCKTNGTSQLTLQNSYVLPQSQPTCDCVNNAFSCPYNFGGYDNVSVCVIDKNDTTAYDCKNLVLIKAQMQTNYGTNPYFTAMPWSCDLLGCRFPLASNASWSFEYSYDQDITPYSQYNAPFIVRPMNVPLTSTSTKLYVAEITNPYVVCNNCTSSYQVLQTLSNTTLNNLTATSSGFMFGGFDISTSTKYFLVSLKSATSSTIYEKQYITLSYSAAERPSGQPDFIWFQNTKDKLKGKLIFAQVFAFSDALSAFLNASGTTGNPLVFTMKSMSANNQFNLDIPIFDFSNSVVVNFAQRMRFLFIAGIWISFGFYLWNMFTKRLFRDDG
ncbi:MAG: hypothetical protein WCX80_02530 [Patescibacteria group bacterium]